VAAHPVGAPRAEVVAAEAAVAGKALS